jgi:hypothetical protein
MCLANEWCETRQKHITQNQGKREESNLGKPVVSNGNTRCRAANRRPGIGHSGKNSEGLSLFLPKYLLFIL